MTTGKEAPAFTEAGPPAVGDVILTEVTSARARAAHTRVKRKASSEAGIRFFAGHPFDNATFTADDIARTTRKQRIPNLPVCG